MRMATGIRQSARTVQTWLPMTGIRVLARLFFRFRIEVSGREEIPPREALLIAAGPHRNWIDAFLILYAMPNQPRVVFLGSEAAGNRWWKRIILWLAGSFEPVSTTSALNREALDASLRVLARGDCLALFPEGWEHFNEPLREVGEFRRGSAFIAQHSGRRVLPVALAGNRPLWRGKTLRVNIAAPLPPPPANASKAEQQAWSEQLRATLQALQPPDPPTIPLAERRWTWLTTLLN